MYSSIKLVTKLTTLAGARVWLLRRQGNLLARWFSVVASPLLLHHGRIAVAHVVVQLSTYRRRTFVELALQGSSQRCFACWLLFLLKKT